MSLQKLKQRALANTEVKNEYDKLESEFSFIDQLLTMRTKAGLTQEQVAERMHTQKSNVSRLEKGNANPSWSTLLKYAHACGFELTLKPQKMS
ncbi:MULTISPECIES: helix-turn-helix domain-containing protein [Gammaproteobacteria]|uniref:XRE family transcriptional regulator n=1 Tax=Alteromonas alba TaxID=2079529 RepID=A0A2S9VCM0_9ALTE|nr:MULTISPECIES: helix-turn-helix transcriptional regulator [Gammaproteobacteria]MBE0067165.1 helix-turn-helix domain-containing protein [Citrobacter freundii]OIZ34935.1 transcriptional regulator [Citrobacter freundii]OVV53400.1 transcriptional regulator [Klebsiella pneumoniae]OVV56798.1 transcriptional regulator [Klebsiella pneumoniae]OVV61796.1 transcriptional regulator [Klebsiella pneumoniae]|tara:strand:+ start:241 stop:519 length:279 start_codon:yes stop_codon:yes gene_type:complete